MENKQPTKKEIEETKENMRVNALKNLRESNLKNLAIAYFTQLNKNYGENDNSAVEESLYFPALNSGTSYYNLESGEESDLLRDSLLNSRQDRKRYSGQVSEYETIKKSAAVIQQSLGAIKVQDLMDLIESKVKIKEDYKDKYIHGLANFDKKDEEELTEEDKFVMKLIKGYTDYITLQGVSESLGKRAENIKGGLEELVKA